MGGDVLRHTANLDLLVSGMCGLFRLGLNCSRWPLSRVESGAKPPGETQNGVSPGPPPVPFELRERLQCGAALVAQGCSEFPLTRKQPIAKSPHGLLCDLSGSRTGLEVRVRKVAC